MTMKKLSSNETKTVIKKFKLKTVKVKGTNVVQIAKNVSPRFEVISFDEFEQTLKKRRLATYKSEKGNFLKIMKNRR